MREIHTEIMIEASAERVWETLTNFQEFSEWNPFMRAIEGELTPGSQLSVHIQPPGGKGMTFKPTVLKADSGRELRWVGHLIFPGLFDGAHHFIIEQLETGQVRFDHGERFTGFLVPVLGLFGVFKNTAKGFEDMNQALKARAEERTPG